MEAGAKVTLIETHVGPRGAAAKAQVNAGTDIAVAEGADVAHIKCVADARRDHASCDLGGADRQGRVLSRVSVDRRHDRLARNQVFATFTGEGAKLDISGCFLGRGSDHIDTTLVVDHAVAGCESRELFKGVLDGRARGVFQGKVIVRPDAQKTDGKQMAQALMLSPDAEFDSKPELEIYADDVVCGHGSTCTEIDPEMMFYLRSRGIPQSEARALLIDSFAGEAIEKIEREDIRDALIADCAAVAEGSLTSRGWQTQCPRLRRRRTQAYRASSTWTASAPISPSCSARSTASRWSISTTVRRRKSPARCSMPSSTPTNSSTPTCIAACTSSPMRRPPSTRKREPLPAGS